MKKVLSLITSVALAGGFLFAPADNKEQPKQVAKETQNVILYAEDPGTGI
ncbi:MULTISPECIES: hypothetical protein [Bacillus]|uniref:Phr family secreted Rap phosphatase inhibitor n=1 Tax=Bacillus thuringiensis TaxID=1428 RepID=A0A0B5NNB0_BACTU|nr:MULTISPECIES: hypothetical protein [Bacillus]AJG73653.1 hypothetical protein BF38_6142 [Bacillus thuringiensis]EEM74659.1 hypothetical protein bthur0010_52730 [Bacillus thuringiensis serovar pondicheriensis BGSC 4BA1]MBP3970008.1 hypothetical protein [Bacillus sp. WL1]MCD1182139.1 hypothetical protein [Bacillus paranthracis]MCR6795706.1 hypothetical protein [Bacillus paranthracis]